jgi:leader peptidase (prepilin peptidase)/N-methyltransferase
VLTSAVLYLLFLKFGLSWPLLVNGVFFVMILALTFIDLEHRILPDRITLRGTVVGFLLAPLQADEYFGSVSWLDAYWQSFLGAALGGGILWVVAMLYLKLRKMEGLGLGDVKMMGLVGAFVGWRFAWLTIFMGSVFGALVGGLYIFVLRKGQRYELPFGTFLGLAAFVATLYGRDILNWYFGG